MQLGDVIVISGVDYVITEMDGNYASKSLPLRDYIEINRLIKYEDKYITIKEIVENLIQDYKSKHN